MANLAGARSRRSIDYVHVPVPKYRSDDAYFAPLSNWTTEAGHLFLGLIHDTDSIDSNLKRIEVARAYADNFGISTECGFGRRPAHSIAALLQRHRQLAEALTGG